MDWLQELSHHARDIETVTTFVTWAVFYLIFAALLLTWIFQALLRPSTRQEWAEFGKITAFLIVVSRTVWAIATDSPTIPQPWALITWLVVGVLVGFYFWVIVDMWGVVLYRRIITSGIESRWKAIAFFGVLLALVALGLHIVVGFPLWP
jgi:hypothetical protein